MAEVVAVFFVVVLYLIAGAIALVSKDWGRSTIMLVMAVVVILLILVASGSFSGELEECNLPLTREQHCARMWLSPTEVESIKKLRGEDNG